MLIVCCCKKERSGRLLFFCSMFLWENEAFFRKYIISVRTSIRAREIENLNIGEDPKDAENKDGMDEYWESFRKFIRLYETELEDNDMHIRSSKALQKIMKNFINVAQTSHGFDVKHRIGMAFRSLISSASMYLEMKVPDDLSDESDRQQAEADIRRVKYEVVQAVEIFKDYIGVLLADMVRSDRPFIEGNTLTHPAIGSATKLLFAYCAILERLVKDLGASDQFSFNLCWIFRRRLQFQKDYQICAAG